MNNNQVIISLSIRLISLVAVVLVRVGHMG
jgi:hypothetical protein